MNFVKLIAPFAHKQGVHAVCLFFLMLYLFLFVSGCGDNVRVSSEKHLAEFEKAGPLYPTADVNQFQNHVSGQTPYHVRPNDVIEITMPAILQVTTAQNSELGKELSPFMCRVSEKGTIELPVAGEIQVEGKTLAQIETAISDAYYPKYTDTRPSIFAALAEKKDLPLFSVLGLVKKPGNFPYPPDVQYNLMQAMGFAEGLDRTAEPRYATIYRLKEDGTITSAVLQVVNTGKESMLTNAINVPIKPGDIIDVEQTPRTRMNEFLKGIFRVDVGTYIGVTDFRNN